MSIQKILRGLANPHQLEKESAEALERCERGANGGVIIPVMHQKTGRRDLLLDSGEGSEIVGEEISGMIYAYQHDSWLLNEARVYPGLIDKTTIPSETTNVAANWVAESDRCDRGSTNAGFRDV